MKVKKWLLPLSLFIILGLVSHPDMPPQLYLAVQYTTYTINLVASGKRDFLNMILYNQKLNLVKQFVFRHSILLLL